MSGKGRRSYPMEKMLEAIQKVKEGFFSAYKAAKVYEVPETTLRDHINGKVKGFSMGPDRMMAPEEEHAVVDHMQYMASRNFPLRRNDIRSLIVDLVTKSGPERIAKCLFNMDKGPSDNWFGKFQARNPQIKWVVPETIDQSRISQSNEFVIDHFFTLYESVLNEFKLHDKPDQIFNCDETGVTSHVATRQKAYGMKGSSVLQEKVSMIDHITAMMTVSASGRVLPSFLIYEKNMPCISMNDNIPKSWLYGSSENGYMDKDLFKMWFRHIFVKNCGKEMPVLLIMDNHDSHFSEEVLTLAKENQINAKARRDS